MKFRYAALLLLWLALVVPASVDHVFNIPVGDYQFKLCYAAAVIGVLGLAVDRQAWPSILASVRRPFYFGLLLLAAAGGIAALAYSTHPSRAFVFLARALATLGLLPLLVFWLHRRLGHVLARSVAIFGLLQALVIIIAFPLCMWTRGVVKLGFVMMYYNDSRDFEQLCRPHAFYQEPGYFAGYALLVMVVLWLSSAHDPSSKWRLFERVTTVILAVAIILTTSRMGWVGVGMLAVAALVSRRSFGAAPVFPPKVKAALWGGSALLLVIASISLYPSWKTAQLTIFDFRQGLTGDPSIRYRFRRSLASYDVFRSSPLVGVGPGTAGAYLVDRLPEHPYLSGVSTASRDFQRRDPLSMNLYTEVLSEWGVLGAIALLLVFFGLIGGGGWGTVLAVGTIAWIATTWQTLARFDLWLMISLIAIYLKPALGAAKERSPVVRT